MALKWLQALIPLKLRDAFQVIHERAIEELETIKSQLNEQFISDLIDQTTLEQIKTHVTYTTLKNYLRIVEPLYGNIEAVKIKSNQQLAYTATVVLPNGQVVVIKGALATGQQYDLELINRRIASKLPMDEFSGATPTDVLIESTVRILYFIQTFRALKR